MFLLSLINNHPYIITIHLIKTTREQTIVDFFYHILFFLKANLTSFGYYILFFNEFL